MHNLGHAGAGETFPPGDVGPAEALLLHLPLPPHRLAQGLGSGRRFPEQLIRPLAALSELALAGRLGYVEN